MDGELSCAASLGDNCSARFLDCLHLGKNGGGFVFQGRALQGVVFLA
jgi:hypothetical protein